MNHKNRISRIIAMVMALVLCAGFMFALPVQAHAATTEGHYTDVYPWENQMSDEYGDTPYMGKTLRARGCGITSVSIILQGLLGDETLTPEYLATTYGDLDNKHPDVDYGSLKTVALSVLDIYGVKTTLTHDFWDVWVALAYGKPVLSLENPGLFTGTPNGHFIAFVGLSDDARVIVRDPNGNRWPAYEEYFEDGFYYSWLCNSGSGYWICELEDTTE